LGKGIGLVDLPLVQRLATMVNWCGHGHEYQPWLQPNGWWLLVPVWESRSNNEGPKPTEPVPV